MMEEMSYEDWKAERQQYLDSRDDFRIEADRIWQSMNTNNDFYFGLGKRIDERESSKVPVAGEGTVEFLTIASGSLKVPARFFLPVRIVYGMLEGAEALARQRAGL